MPQNNISNTRHDHLVYTERRKEERRGEERRGEERRGEERREEERRGEDHIHLVLIAIKPHTEGAVVRFEHGRFIGVVFDYATAVV